MDRIIIVALAFCMFFVQGAAALDTPEAQTPPTTAPPASSAYSPISWCWLGPDHPDSCTTGVHTRYLLTQLVFIPAFPVGRATQEMVWSGGTYTFSCVGLAEGVAGSCTSSGPLPPVGATYTHNCWTDEGTVGVVGCTIIEP